MRYSRVHLDSIGYELAPVVVSTSELERRIEEMTRERQVDRNVVTRLRQVSQSR